MNMKKLTLAAAAAFSLPLAACNAPANDTASSELEISQAELKKAHDDQTATNMLNCTSDAYVAARKMEPNYKGTYSDERKAWHQNKISSCVNGSSGNLFIYTYDKDKGVRAELSKAIANAEISAWEKGEKPEYPTVNQVSTMLSNARK